MLGVPRGARDRRRRRRRRRFLLLLLLYGTPTARMDALSAEEPLDDDLVVQSGSGGSDVESLMCLLRSQIKQAGVHSLSLSPSSALAVCEPAASADLSIGSISKDGFALGVADSPVQQPGPGVTSGTLEVSHVALRFLHLLPALGPLTLFYAAGAGAAACERRSTGCRRWLCDGAAAGPVAAA